MLKRKLLNQLKIFSIDFYFQNLFEPILLSNSLNNNLIPHSISTTKNNTKKYRLVSIDIIPNAITIAMMYNVCFIYQRYYKKR